MKVSPIYMYSENNRHNTGKESHSERNRHNEMKPHVYFPPWINVGIVSIGFHMKAHADGNSKDLVPFAQIIKNCSTGELMWCQNEMTNTSSLFSSLQVHLFISKETII